MFWLVIVYELNWLTTGQNACWR